MPCSPSACTSTAVYDLVERIARSARGERCGQGLVEHGEELSRDVVGQSEQWPPHRPTVDSLMGEAELGLGVVRAAEALLARQREEAGEVGALRGMPLGLPAVSAEDVQLVESWIASGAGE